MLAVVLLYCAVLNLHLSKLKPSYILVFKPAAKPARLNAVLLTPADNAISAR